MTDKLKYFSYYWLIIFILCAVFTSYAKEGDKTDVKIVTAIEKSGYNDQVFTYVVKLLSSSAEIADIRVAKAPSMPEGVKIVKGIVRNSRPEQENIKGKTYYSWVIRRDFLIPTSTGKFTIGDSKYVAFIPHKGGFYTDFWGRHQVVDYEEVPLDCKATDFRVENLPQNKTGLEFSGCIGNYNIEGWFPPGKISAGQEAYVVFSISGFGSLQNLTLPNIYKIFGKGCQLKEVEQNENQSQRNGALYSEVTLTCRFLPETDDFTIDPLCLLFFDPESKRYVKKCSEPLQWTGQPAGKSLTTPKDAVEI